MSSFTTGLKHGMQQTHQTHHTTGSTGHHTYGGNSTTHYSNSGYGSAVVSTSQNTRKISEVTTSEALVLPNNAYEQSRRQVSSVIIFEEAEQVAAPNVRYVEVPQYEEVIKHVTVKEVREVEKVVPKIVEEWVERIVEVPQIEEVVRQVEVPQIQEVVKHVPKIEIVDRPYEVVKNVPKIEIQKVEKVVELPAETIEVPKVNNVEERVSIASVEDSEAMLVVRQKVTPVIIDGGREIAVDVIEYEPEVMPVDIHVAKFVEQELVMMGAKETIHRVVTVGAAQYNSMLRYLNVHLSHDEIQNLPYLMDSTGQVSFLPQEYKWTAPQEGLKIYGYRAGTIWGHGSVVQTRSYGSGMSASDVRVKQAELDRQFQQIFQQFESEKTRRVQVIETFNREQEMRCRQMITSTTHSTSHHAISYNQPSGAHSTAYKVGHTIGSTVGSLMN